MPPSRAGEKLEAEIFTRLGGFGLVFSGMGNGHQQSLHSTVAQILFTNICRCKEWYAKHVTARKERMPLNASFLSRGKARGRDLHSPCRLRRIGYIAPANSDTEKGYLHNLHSKMDTNLAHKYLQVQAIASKSCKTPNLHRIYENLWEFTPLFEEFTKNLRNLQRKLLRPPPPFVSGLNPLLPLAHARARVLNTTAPQGRGAKPRSEDGRNPGVLYPQQSVVHLL